VRKGIGGSQYRSGDDDREAHRKSRKSVYNALIRHH
jgi:hypothetical protein